MPNRVSIILHFAFNCMHTDTMPDFNIRTYLIIYKDTHPTFIPYNQHACYLVNNLFKKHSRLPKKLAQVGYATLVPNHVGCPSKHTHLNL